MKYKHLLTLGDPDNFVMKDCNLLKRSITNAGFGYSFNSIDYWMMYKKTTFTKTFAKIMTPKGHEKIPDQVFDWKSHIVKSGKFSKIYKMGNILRPETSGPSNTLVLVLESPKLYYHSIDNRLYDNIFYKSTGRAFKVRMTRLAYG